MINSRLLATFFCCFLSLSAIAEAPVVDDSENFAMLDEQQAMERPVAKDTMGNFDNEENTALAHEDVNNSDGEAELLTKIKNLEQEIQELRGQLEVQNHDLKVLKEQQLTFYKDIDSRLSTKSLPKPDQAATQTQPSLTIDGQPLSEELSSRASAAAIQAPINTPPVTNPAEEQISYLAAYELVKNKRFDEALLAMQDFITKYPRSSYMSNAEYWLGELYMVKKNYPQAINHFELVLTNFPSSSKAAASTLKIGYALAASGKEAAAQERLLQVIKDYPETPTAQLAATKLKTFRHS